MPHHSPSTRVHLDGPPTTAPQNWTSTSIVIKKKPQKNKGSLKSGADLRHGSTLLSNADRAPQMELLKRLQPSSQPQSHNSPQDSV